MKKIPVTFFVLSLLMCVHQNVHAQFLKKLKDKVNSMTGNTTQTSSTSTTSNSSNGSPANTTGAGLTNTPPPDVPTNIASAQSAMKDSNMSQARYALQQAIMGVEIKLGKQILQSLPNTVDALNKDTSKNVVASTQFGWSNTTIQTVYSNGSNKQMTVSIGNLPLYAGLVSMYFSNAAYMQTNQQQDQNIKQTQVKGEKAIIQFDQSKGYSLIAQLGQSTVMVWECVNFATEDEVMSAANSFDIAGIKKMMGEQ